MADWAWMSLFDRHVGRLVQLGYAPAGARQQLKWPLGRMVLHRGDPDLDALTIDDLDELRAAVDRFTARLRMEPLREFYSRSRSVADQPDSARDYFSTVIARMHAVQVLLFNVGQIDRAPSGRIDAGTRTDHLAPPRHHRRSVP